VSLLSLLPTLNAALNATSTVLLIVARRFIRRGRIDAHRRTMIAAFVTSCLFLVSYVVYHAQIGSRPFPGRGPIRVIYFTILITHVVLAAVIVPLVLVTLRRGLHRDDARHRAIARWTWPLWLYVSVTGVIIYGMLYHLY
jgi:putative membrane protein